MIAYFLAKYFTYIAVYKTQIDKDASCTVSLWIVVIWLFLIVNITLDDSDSPILEPYPNPISHAPPSLSTFPLHISIVGVGIERRTIIGPLLW